LKPSRSSPPAQALNTPTQPFGDERHQPTLVPEDAREQGIAIARWARALRARHQRQRPLLASLQAGTAAETDLRVHLRPALVLGQGTGIFGQADALGIAGTQTGAAVVAAFGIDLGEKVSMIAHMEPLGDRDKGATL